MTGYLFDICIVCIIFVIFFMLCDEKNESTIQSKRIHNTIHQRCTDVDVYLGPHLVWVHSWPVLHYNYITQYIYGGIGS